MTEAEVGELVMRILSEKGVTYAMINIKDMQEKVRI